MSFLIWLSIIANIIFLLAPPAWVAATFLAWVFWFWNPSVSYGDFYKFQLMTFCFTLPGLIGLGASGSAVAGGLYGWWSAKL